MYATTHARYIARVKNNDAQQAFATWLHDQLTANGYVLTQRGGGRARFAEASGISAATVSRLLRGEGATDTRILGLLAEALHVPLATVLVRAGILDAADLERVASRQPDPDKPPITPEEAAAELGITDPQAVRVFVATAKALQRPVDVDDRRAEH